MPEAPFDLVDARDPFTDTDWFHACLKHQTPYVVVRSGEHRADVLWDYVTLPLACDLRIREDFARLERDARAIFERFADADSYLRIKPTLICFDQLPTWQAKRAASELYGLIAAYLPNQRAPAVQPASQPPSLESDHAPRVHDINREPQQGARQRRFWVEDNDPSSSAA